MTILEGEPTKEMSMEHKCSDDKRLQCGRDPKVHESEDIKDRQAYKSPHLYYINAYAVTRHYGGPEEGGWWYNAGRPLASIPWAAPEALMDNEGFILWDRYPKYEKDIDKVKEKLRQSLKSEEYGDIYSMLGGQAVNIRFEKEIAKPYPEERPHYE